MLAYNLGPSRYQAAAHLVGAERCQVGRTSDVKTRLFCDQVKN